VTRPDPAPAAAAPRERFLRNRRQALRGAAVALLPLAGVGWLLGAPGELASVRLGPMSLAWWAALAAWGFVLGALLLRPRVGRPVGEPR